MDKTAGIKTELDKMIANGEIDESNLEQIKEMIQYLTHNNISKFTKGKNVDLLPKEIVELLDEDRQRYSLKKKRLSDATFKIITDHPIDLSKIREIAHEHAAKEIIYKEREGEDE